MKYQVFITYSHANSRAARRLQRSLENYRVPKRLVGEPGSYGPVPDSLKPVFVDRTDLRSGANLSREIAIALRESRTLIVLCSPSAAESKWVDQEIREFQSLGRQDKIFPAIVDPGPRRLPTDAMPLALRRQRDQNGLIIEVEPLAADFRKDGFRDAKLKLVAGILGVDFDSLRQREKIRRSRRLFLFTATIAVGLALSALAYIALADQGAHLWANGRIRRFLDQHDISWFRHAPSTAEIAHQAATARLKLIANERKDLKQAALLDQNGNILSIASDGRRLGGTWELGQIVNAVAQAPEASSDDIEDAKKAIQILFEPGRATVQNGVCYGWLRYRGDHPQGEAALWPVVAITALMSRPGALSENEREQFTQHLRFAEDAASLYYNGGGWMNLPNQIDRNQCGLYTTLLGLKALLAVRDAHQQWSGRDVDDMIASTAKYLLRAYDHEGKWANSPGWHGIGQMRDVTPIDTLTLFSYALLLKASDALPREVNVPSYMKAAIRGRLIKFESETIEPFATDQDQFQTRFVDLDGKEKTGGYTWKYPWYPYAVLLAKTYFDQLQATKSQSAEIVAARRILARVIALAPQVAKDSDTFYRHETLWSLDAFR